MKVLSVGLSDIKTKVVVSEVKKTTAKVLYLGEDISLLDMITNSKVDDLAEALFCIAEDSKSIGAKVQIAISSNLVRTGCWYSQEVKNKMDCDGWVRDLFSHEKKDGYTIEVPGDLIHPYNQGQFVTASGINRKYIETILKAARKAQMTIDLIESEAVSTVRYLQASKNITHGALLEINHSSSSVTFFHRFGISTSSRNDGWTLFLDEGTIKEVDEMVVLNLLAAQELFNEPFNGPIYLLSEKMVQLKELFNESSVAYTTNFSCPHCITSKKYSSADFNWFASAIGLILTLIEEGGENNAFTGHQSNSEINIKQQDGTSRKRKIKEMVENFRHILGRMRKR